jgi:hypothetical protein
MLTNSIILAFNGHDTLKHLASSLGLLQTMYVTIYVVNNVVV